MYITTTKLLTYLTKDASLHDLISTIKVILKLLGKYGKAVFHSSFLAKLETIDPTIFSCLTLLKKAGRTKQEQVKYLLQALEQRAQDTDTYTIDTQWENIDTIKEILVSKNQKPLRIIHNKKKVCGLRIQGGGKYYERTLEQDLEKLLKAPKK